MEDGESADFSFRFEHVDDAPCTELRHREPRDVGQGLLVVERLEEGFAYRSEEKRSALRLAAIYADRTPKTALFACWPGPGFMLIPQGRVG